MIHIIGGGGVGSWLTPSICLLKGKRNVTVIDGDKLERKNLNRQLFKDDQIGENKAEALAGLYGCEAIGRWYSFGLVEHQRSDWLLVCVDNNAARKSALDACDRYRCRAIFAANETHSAESFYYQPNWRGTRLDPRVYYPTILTDSTNDPRAAAAGCTGEFQEQNPQLVTSNSMAASLAGHLFALWDLKARTFDKEVLPTLPFRFRANMTKLETDRCGTI